MRRPIPRRLLLVCGVLLLVVLAVAGGLKACTAPRGLTFAQYEGLARAGKLAGLATTLTSPPQKPSVNLEQQRASYQNVPTCTAYWTSASEHQLGMSSAQVADPDGLVTTIDTELWDDAGSAAAAMDSWSNCLRDFQEVSSTSYPVKVTSHGVVGEVAWQYSESLDLSTPVHVLTLRDRNVLVSLDTTDAPPSDVREQLIGRLAADVEAAAKR